MTDRCIVNVKVAEQLDSHRQQQAPNDAPQPLNTFFCATHPLDTFAKAADSVLAIKMHQNPIATVIALGVFIGVAQAAHKCYVCASTQTGTGALSVASCPWKGFKDAYKKDKTGVIEVDGCDHCVKTRNIVTIQSTKTTTVSRSCITAAQTAQFIPSGKTAKDYCKELDGMDDTKDSATKCCSKKFCNSAPVIHMAPALMTAVVLLTGYLTKLM